MAEQRLTSATASVRGDDASAAADPGAGSRAADAPAANAGASASDTFGQILRPVLAVVANVTVLTALLVYFGWRRSETQAQLLGFDESILGMSTRDYVLRSVGAVLVLLVGMAMVGVLLLTLERVVTPILRPSAGGIANSHMAVALLVGLVLVSILVPVVVRVTRSWWPERAYIAYPASIGIGIVLLLYALHVRRDDSDGGSAERRRRVIVTALGGLLVVVCVFWTASNYAEVLGTRLARDFANNVERQPGVVVYSQQPLHIEGPGVVETELAGDELGYRYTGLRFLERTGGRLFLVSDGWTPRYGVVFVLRDDSDSLRFDFVRDRR